MGEIFSVIIWIAIALALIAVWRKKKSSINKQLFLALAFYVMLAGIFSHIYYYIYTSAEEGKQNYYVVEHLVKEIEKDNEVEIEQRLKRINENRAQLRNEKSLYLILKNYFEETGDIIKPRDMGMTRNEFQVILGDSLRFDLTFHKAIEYESKYNKRASNTKFEIYRYKTGKLSERELYTLLPDSVINLESKDRYEYEKALDDFLLVVERYRYIARVDSVIKQIDEEIRKLNANLKSATAIDSQYAEMPNLSYFHFLYLSVLTQTTIGASDILPNSDIVRFFMVVQVFTSILIISFLVNAILSNRSKNTVSDQS